MREYRVSKVKNIDGIPSVAGAPGTASSPASGRPNAPSSTEAAQPEFWERERAKQPAAAVSRSLQLMDRIVSDYQPTHIVAMVSGGRDSAAAYELAEQMGVKIDLILHGRTGTGIPQTTQFVADHYGAKRPDFAIADAGDAYERYVSRKGFFGAGREAHNFSYRILKADPFRAAISRLIRQRRRGYRVMLLTGARKSESENRRLNLKESRLDKGNLWVNICHDWSAGERDQFLDANQVEINPVAVQLCRSGECMCGTMQTVAERSEAAALYPAWGAWLDDLEQTVRRKHGFGWGEPFPRPSDPRQSDMFQPLCDECTEPLSGRMLERASPAERSPREGEAVAKGRAPNVVS